MYNWKTHRGQSVPNIATWIVWSIASVLNLFSYFFMSEDWVKALPSLASSIACLLTFALALRKGRLTRLNRIDATILVLSACAVLAWWIWRSATCANLILQIGFLLSFVPTWRDVWRKPVGESMTPWLMWGGVYCLLIVTVLLRWSGHWPDLVY